MMVFPQNLDSSLTIKKITPPIQSCEKKVARQLDTGLQTLRLFTTSRDCNPTFLRHLAFYSIISSLIRGRIYTLRSLLYGRRRKQMRYQMGTHVRDMQDALSSTLFDSNNFDL